MKLLAFDLEIATSLPDETREWKQYRPLGITCWAAAWVDEETSKIATTFYSGTDDNGGITPRMSVHECKALVWYLESWIKQDYTLLTHNGVSFDLYVVAEESGLHDRCVELAMNSVDTCLLMHCIKGFPVGLDAICKGFGIEGKLEGINGALAPQMWSEGRYDEVLRYVAQDAKCTLEVALAIEKYRLLRWVSQRGMLKTQFMPVLLPVRDALKLPVPDVRWMDKPMPRESFTAWMTKVPE